MGNCPKTEIKRGCYFVLLLPLLVKIYAVSFNVNMTNHSQDITKKQVTIILHKQTLLCNNNNSSNIAKDITHSF